LSNCVNHTNKGVLQHPNTTKIDGLTLVAPSHPFTKNPMSGVQNIGADWVAVVPYAYLQIGTTEVQYNNAQSKWQWWGEQLAGVKETIRLAKAAHLNILLKPQVYIPSSWMGELSYEMDEDWAAWEESYMAYILLLADVAAANEVELFCVGTEFKVAAVERETYWRRLIQNVQKRYTGKLVYAANWDNYERIPFWDALDYIGINAYFPLTASKTPKVQELKKAWQATVAAMNTFQASVDKPILFTEFGYLAVDGCAYNTWELEATMRQMPLNEEAQSNALEALFQVFWAKGWWHGGFLWKWYPELEGTAARQQMDYTPQGKKGVQTIEKWYK
ncbi:MAG: hypothetical protein AAF738_04405, partial [Bacteroidota bacterium]